MNKRIDELAQKAGIFKPKEFYQHIDALQLEKFAELIVRDCMLICEDVMKKDNSALGCWSEIKRTFRS